MIRAIVTYCWPGVRDYQPQHVNALAAMCALHAPECRFVCVTDGFDAALFDPKVTVVPTPPEALAIAHMQTPEGERFPSSYRRLWTFSAAARCLGDVVLLLDVDCIVCGALAPYFEYEPDAPFVGWRPRSQWGTLGRLGGGTWRLRTGSLTHMWKSFSADPPAAIAAAAAAGWRGSDQAILSYHLAATAPSFPEPSGIYQSQDYPVTGEWSVPDDARILHFNGKRKPWNRNRRRPWVNRLYESVTAA